MVEYEDYFRKLYEVCGRLQQKYPSESKLEELQMDIDILQQKYTNKDEATKCLHAFQNINDYLFDNHGVCEDIIDFQVLINKLRNKLDVTDPKEVVVHAADGDFVQ